MNVIFLDFDGVITTPRSKWEVDYVLLDRVKFICEECDAKIVVSSTWQGAFDSVDEWLDGNRMKGERETTREFFKEYGYGLTGRFYGEYGCVRGSDIKSWLARHPEVTNYVIIDDEDDMLDEQLFHFVQTDYPFGIQEREVELAISVLKDNVKYPLALNDTLKFKRWLTFPFGQVNDFNEIWEKYGPKDGK